MAKLFFHFSTMNAGKTTLLIQAKYNYAERGMKSICFIPDFIAAINDNKICSRIGIEVEAISFDKDFIFDKFIDNLNIENDIDCIFIDEAQFLTKQQVKELCIIVDKYNIPVLTYGLRTDFQGNLFEGSQYLLAWADKIVEVKTICFCGKKANMAVRIDSKHNVITDGKVVVPGDNNMYIPLCRKHYYECIESTIMPKDWYFI